MKGSSSALTLLAFLGFVGMLFGEYLLITRRAPYEQIVALGVGGFAVVVVFWALADGLDLLSEIAAQQKRSADALERRMGRRSPSNGTPK